MFTAKVCEAAIKGLGQVCCHAHTERSAACGVLTAKLPNALFIALSHAQLCELLESVLFCENSGPPPVFANAQIIIARNVGGTINDLTRKSQRIFLGDTRRNGNWMSQNMKYDASPVPEWSVE